MSVRAHLLLVPFSLVLLVSEGFSKTWFVGGSGADYDQIQPAIDAAQDGDVILVRPGTYEPFVLDKGVIVRSSTAPFEVAATVQIVGIPAGLRAGIAGMDSTTALGISDCGGEVVLENITLHQSGFLATNRLLSVVSSANVSFTDLTATSDGSMLFGGEPSDPRDVIRIENSRVRMADVTVRGCSGFVTTGLPGGPGIGLQSSLLVLSSPLIRGGAGANGGCGYDPSQGHYWLDGGHGGDALRASDSTVTILGTESHELRGGDGGPADDCGAGRQGNGGAGGTGLRLDDTSSAEVSRVVLLGGPGGSGQADGGDGPDFTGSVTRIDQFPVLDMTRDLHPGSPIVLTLDAVEQSNVVLLVSDRGDFANLKGFGGPPWSVLPGAFFVVLFVGSTDAAGDLSYAAGRLPNDPAVWGLPLDAQALAFSISGMNHLSNALARVVGE